jgi:hypothetical protein
VILWSTALVRALSNYFGYLSARRSEGDLSERLGIAKGLLADGLGHQGGRTLSDDWTRNHLDATAQWSALSIRANISTHREIPSRCKARRRRGMPPRSSTTRLEVRRAAANETGHAHSHPDTQRTSADDICQVHGVQPGTHRSLGKLDPSLTAHDWKSDDAAVVADRCSTTRNRIDRPGKRYGTGLALTRSTSRSENSRPHGVAVRARLHARQGPCR